MLTEIMAATDRKAALCGLGDRELDRVCAEARGWEVREEEAVRVNPHDLTPCGTYVHEVICTPDDDAIRLRDYTPSRDLNQAYELFSKTRLTSIGRYQQDGEWANRCRWDMRVDDKEAKSHSRAVAILSCLALMEGME